MTETLIDRLGKDPEGTAIVQTVVAMGLAVFNIQNETTQHDVGAAIETFMDVLFPENPIGPVWTAQARPATTDTRPLYQRLDDEDPDVRVVFAKGINYLELYCNLIEDFDLWDKVGDARQAMGRAFGLPVLGEDDPANFPGVRHTSVSQEFTKRGILQAREDEPAAVGTISETDSTSAAQAA